MTVIMIMMGSIAGLAAGIYSWLAMDMSAGMAFLLYMATSVTFGSLAVMSQLLRHDEGAPATPV